jgi:hypothetical protein
LTTRRRGREASALIGSMRERILIDLDTATQLIQGEESSGEGVTD